MSVQYSYRHLYYFWVVAKEGGMSRAAARLDIAVQTVSTQVRELERSLGHALFRPEGRGLALTDAGLACMRMAEQIFHLGEQLPAVVRDAATATGLHFAVGVLQALPKLAMWRLLEPVLDDRAVRLRCSEAGFEPLLADLALHRLDVVLADRPAPPNPNLRVYSHLLESSGLGWYASRRWWDAARRGFPQSLAKVPVLLPSTQAAVRSRLDHWFERHAILPMLVAEFDDSALLKTFASGGLGVFPAALKVHDEIVQRYAVRRIGLCDGVEEQYFAIGTERKASHPLVRRLVEAGAAAAA